MPEYILTYSKPNRENHQKQLIVPERRHTYNEKHNKRDMNRLRYLSCDLYFRARNIALRGKWREDSEEEEEKKRS